MSIRESVVSWLSTISGSVLKASTVHSESSGASLFPRVVTAALMSTCVHLFYTSWMSAGCRGSPLLGI